MNHSTIDPRTLRITDMRFVDIDGAPKRCTILKLMTNQGLVGYGEVRDASSKTYALMLKSRLLGENPCDVDRIFQKIKQFGGPSRQAGGVCGVEIALWDLAGKAYGVPVYQLLGGKFRDKVRVYCDTDVDGKHTGHDMGLALKKRMEMGFTFLKMDLGIGMLLDEPGTLNAPLGFIDEMKQYAPHILNVQGGSVTADMVKHQKSYQIVTTAHPFTGIHLTEKGLDYLENYVKEVRDVIGYEVPLAIDHFGHVALEDCIRFARRMEKYNLAWMEDMAPWMYTDHYVRLRNATTVPVCTGEDIYLKEGFEKLIDAGGVSVIHPDILTCGGALELKKIADYADEHGVAVAIHMAESPIACMAAVHAAAAMHNVLALEFHSVDVPWWKDMVNGLPQPLIENGFINVPDAPGLGIESLNEELLAKHISFLENSDEVVYSEDIFVGYRYFETFTQSNVQFPFGFGLSYTRFRTETCSVHLNDGVLKINVKVTNIGDNPGKEVVQVYFGVSNGEICRAARELAAFEKTDELKAGESQNIEFSVPINRMRAFDDLGKTGHQFCFVLEAGTYAVYVGTDVRTAEAVFSWSQRETKVVKQLTHRFGLNRPIKRMNGTGERVEEIHAENYQPKMDDGTEIAYTGNVGITLVDVYLGRSTMERFIAQLSDFDLACLSQGEGMNSPKVRPGTGGAIGGLTDRLRNMEIPAVCVTDGPSGLRFDNGDPATSLPNGTLIACTWNRSLVRALYVCEGKEAKENRVDALLGPGLNIHRFPLCGRNFEYLSEDPFLTGEIGTAICEGLYDGGVTATIKHFAANNREDRRYWSDSVVSERALREIYLRPFEIVLKSNKVCMIMTAYNQLNGVYCSANYDLAAGVLREEWGFQGLVMTDWGAKTGISIEGKAMNERVSQILSQNDVYMVNENAETVADTLQSVIRTGILSRAAMQRNAMNICRTVMRLPTFLRMVDEINQDKSMA